MRKANSPSKDSSKAISRSQAIEEREKKEQADEALILSLLEKEADAFVPNVYPIVKSRTGLFSAIETREELSLTEILGNEGSKMVPDLEKLIYEKAGLRKRFRLSDHFNFRQAATGVGTVLSLVIVSAAALASTGLLAGPSETPGALIHLSISPASSQLENATLKSDGTANPYKPEFVIVPTTEGSLYKNGVYPMNLSATYLVDPLAETWGETINLKSGFESIFEEAYQNGYIEAKTPNNYNVIEISIVTDQENYRSLYLDGIESALRASLEDQKVYAELSFTCSLVEPSISNMSYEQASGIYAAYSVLGQKIPFRELLEEAASIVEALKGVGSALAAAPLSDWTRLSISRGLSISYEMYANGADTTWDKTKVEELKEEFLEEFDAIPWPVSPSLLSYDPYYLINDPSFYESLDSEEKALADLFFEIQRGILSLAASSKENYLAFLQMTTDFLLDVAENPSLCPDPFGYAYDPGGHKPGPGPTSEGWGEGNIICSER